MTTSVSARSKSERRNRSATDGEVNYGGSMSEETFVNPHKVRLYELFDLMDKEFDALYAENSELRARISVLTGTENEQMMVPQESFPTNNDSGKGKGKGIQMGQKLRTALRGPQTRLVFKVGGDGSRFRCTRRLEGHRDGVWHVASDVGKGLCASASADQTARIWSLDSGVCIATYLGHTGSVNCVAFARSDSGVNEGMIATASGDESAHIWKVPAAPQHSSEEEMEEGEETGDGNIGANSIPDGTRIRSPLLRLTGHVGVVTACDWLTGCDQLITSSWDRNANIYDVERGEILNILSGHEQELNHCSAHPSQRLVVTSSKDSTFRLWDFRDPIQSVAVFQGHQDSVSSVAFSTGDRIVSGSDDRTVKVWDLRNMRSAIATIRLPSPVNRLSVSQAHGAVAIPLDNRHVRIYDLNGNRVARVPNRRCHTRMVSCVTWADDHPQNNLITAGFDRAVVAWKVALQKE